MSSDESSELSSVPSDSESELRLTKKDGILRFFSKDTHNVSATTMDASPPRPKREPSPPHEYILADNPDIAFIVMFRSRFNDAFSKSLPNFGPQELERDIVDVIPGDGVEQFLCALLGLLLNRKQDVKAGHYNRALEEAIQTHKTQWAKDWENKNPLSGGATFASMGPNERLTLLRTLILWALSSSEVVKGIIQTSYKQNRHEDDLNQPLSVQPWGTDSDRRRYYLIEGIDTHFRVYRESNYMGLKRTWWSVANDIDELKKLGERLRVDDDGQKAKLLSSRIMAAIPRFEATEEKRKRKEYRVSRKQQFKRPEPNYSIYEGRTRGKRMKYTYSDEDEEDTYSDATASRRSTRNTGIHTPAEYIAPTVTQSGRQVRARQGGIYGGTTSSGVQSSGITIDYHQIDSEEDGSEDVAARPRRVVAAIPNGYAANRKGGRHIEGYNDVDEMASDEDVSEQDYGDDEEEEEEMPLDSDDDELNDLTEDDVKTSDAVPKKLIVKLQLKTPTPEPKNILKLQPREKDQAKSTTGLLENIAEPGYRTDDISADENLPRPVSQSDVAPNAIVDAMPLAKSPTTSQPISAPFSPLEFPSPEKPRALMATIDVGF